MSLGYRLLYRLGLTPWERRQVPRELVRLVEDPGAPRPSKALDLGCGTGRDAVYLARRGWEVTGVDVVPRAIARARVRAAEAQVRVRFLEGDVTRLPALGLGTGYGLIFDAGCFHGLPDDSRAAYVRGVNALRGPEARLLLFALGPGWRGPGPRGASTEELSERFRPGWRLVSTTAADPADLPRPLRGARPAWHLLQSVA